MKTKNFLLICMTCILSCQMGFGQIESEIKYDGIVFPKLTTAQRNASGAVDGTVIYNTSTIQFEYYKSGSWLPLDTAGAGAPDKIMDNVNGDTYVQALEGQFTDQILFNLEGGPSSIRMRNSSGGDAMIEFLDTNNNRNTFIGRAAGNSNYGGEGNVYVGELAGEFNGSGDENVMIGNGSGEIATGDRNVYIGSGTGKYNSGSDNVIIGQNTGQTSGINNRLMIGNTNGLLIYGQFDTKLMAVNSLNPSAYLHIKQTTTNEEALALENNGNGDDVWAFEIGASDLNISYDGTNVGAFDDSTGNYVPSSDKSLKSEIEAVEVGTLSKLMELTPSKYFFKHDKERTKKAHGFIAQDVQKVFPDLVSEYDDDSGLLKLDYTGMGVLAVKAIQEQQDIIAELLLQVNELQKLTSELVKEISTSQVEANR